MLLKDKLYLIFGVLVFILYLYITFQIINSLTLEIISRANVVAELEKSLQVVNDQTELKVPYNTTFYFDTMLVSGAFFGIFIISRLFLSY